MRTKPVENGAAISKRFDNNTHKTKITRNINLGDSKLPLTKRFSGAAGHKMRAVISTNFKVGGNY